MADTWLAHLIDGPLDGRRLVTGAETIEIVHAPTVGARIRQILGYYDMDGWREDGSRIYLWKSHYLAP